VKGGYIVVPAVVLLLLGGSHRDCGGWLSEPAWCCYAMLLSARSVGVGETGWGGGLAIHALQAW
jgi:hypothetical protein